ncbi:unnamed protein product [Sphacelaria rigidula]
MREELGAPAAVPWTGDVEPRSDNTQSTSSTMDTWTVGIQQHQLQQEEPAQEQEQPQTQRQTPVSDFSSLYSPHRAVSSSQLYPAFVPATAPSTEAMRAYPTVSQAQTTAEPSTVVQAAAAQTAARREAMVNTRTDLSMGSAVAAVQRESAVATTSSGESSTEVVEELLSENEKLRLIIEDMKEELARVSAQNQAGNGVEAATSPESASAIVPAEAPAAAAPAGPAPQTRTLASAMAQYPGAQAEANRRRNEQRQGSLQQEVQQQIQQQVYTQQQQEQLGRGVFVHFKCENCPQWLKVPGHAQLVYCPTCRCPPFFTNVSLNLFCRQHVDAAFSIPVTQSISALSREESVVSRDQPISYHGFNQHIRTASTLVKEALLLTFSRFQGRTHIVPPQKKKMSLPGDRTRIIST